jgi:hypothetical protein
MQSYQYRNNEAKSSLKENGIRHESNNGGEKKSRDGYQPKTKKIARKIWRRLAEKRRKSKAAAKWRRRQWRLSASEKAALKALSVKCSAIIEISENGDGGENMAAMAKKKLKSINEEIRKKIGESERKSNGGGVIWRQLMSAAIRNEVIKIMKMKENNRRMA